MDASERDKSEIQKGSGNSNLSSLDSEWEFLGTNLTDASVELVPINTHILIPSSSRSLEPVVDPFGLAPIIANSRLAGVSIASSSNSMAWDSSPSSMNHEAFFLSNAPGVLPLSIPQFSADSGFIERAARFSCFSTADNIGVMMTNSFDSTIESLHPRSSRGLMREHLDASRTNESRSVSSRQSHKNGAIEGNESRDVVFTETKGPEAKEHKPSETDKAAEKQKRERSPSKQESQASDHSKGEYIHVRARRGQATNSHSLAERVRREKISERMKLLQDLVPGCNKVTGKAVMLDEIINYVQSLQRQVEFLSMKLATVSSRSDLEIEGLLTKETLHQRSGPSALRFPQDSPMAYLPLQQAQHTLTPLVSSYLNPSGVLWRSSNPELPSLTAAANRGYRDKLLRSRDNELRDAVHMSHHSTRCETQETANSASRAVP